MRSSHELLPALLGALLGVVLPNFGHAQVIYGFSDPAAGVNPFGPVIMNASGALFGVTFAGGPAKAGTVYRLTPPGPGQTQWVETTLYSFLSGSDGGYPEDPLTMGSDGALYGTTENEDTSDCAQPNPACGTAFMLTPPKSGQGAWTKTTIYAFAGTPNSGLLLGPDGSLYGELDQITAPGAVYKLSPPSGQSGWTYSTVYQFTGGSDGSYPVGGLIASRNGALFGTAGGGGAAGDGNVFRLRPNASGAWRLSVLYSFVGGADGSYPLGLIGSSSGTLFGVTGYGGAFSGSQGNGTVYELTPTPGHAWEETVIQRFSGGADGSGPTGGAGGLLLTIGGRLLGIAGGGPPATQGLCHSYGGCGVLYQLAPPSSGSGEWSRTSTRGFLPKYGAQGTGLFLGTDHVTYVMTNNFGPAAGDHGTIIALLPAGS